MGVIRGHTTGAVAAVYLSIGFLKTSGTSTQPGMSGNNFPGILPEQQTHAYRSIRIHVELTDFLSGGIDPVFKNRAAQISCSKSRGQQDGYYHKGLQPVAPKTLNDQQSHEHKKNQLTRSPLGYEHIQCHHKTEKNPEDTTGDASPLQERFMKNKINPECQQGIINDMKGFLREMHRSNICIMNQIKPGQIGKPHGDNQARQKTIDVEPP